VNKNTKDLKYIREQDDEHNFIDTIILRKREKLYQKIEYFDSTLLLYMVIDLVLNDNSY